jgi:ribosomal-protein-alanine N-acetyltransferase
MVLEHGRITLEKIAGKHCSGLFDLLSDPDVLATLTLNKPQNLDEMRKFISFCEREWNLDSDFTYTILMRNQAGDLVEKQVIGQITLYDLSFLHSRAEIGLWIGKPYWRQGFGFEALQQLIQYAFTDLNLNRIQAHIFPENTRSIHLFEKIGFKYEGLNRQYVKKQLSYRDVVMYAYLKTDYMPNNSSK